MAKDYDFYSDIKNVYDAKVGWNQATTDEERKKWSSVADAARKRLYDYGYKDIADQISGSGADATATRKILEAYAPKETTTATTTAIPSVTAKTTPDSTTLTNKELITTNNNEVRNKTNQLWGTQTNDRNVMANKYDKLEETAYSNPFDSAESKAIMGKYDLAALYGRDNAVASGGASNGGNIDSYASANAMRQQASLINQGQMAVLDSHNNKINNVKGILESLGVYQQNQDKGMQTTIALQANEGQRLFENEETAKNNEAARQEVYSNISGKVGDTVTKLLNSYTWNEDGTLKNPSQDFQATINTLEKALYSATTDAEKAKILEQLRIQEAARNQKIDEQGLNVAKTYKYQGNPQSQASYEFDAKDKLARDTLTAEQNATNAGYKNEIDKINAQKEADLALADKKANQTNYDLDDVIKMLKNTKTPSQELINLYNSFGIDGTTYTTDNPPPMTGANLDDSYTPTVSGDTEDEYPAYTAWNAAGINLQNHLVAKPDEETHNAKIKESGVDQYGKKAINSVYTAVANGKLDSDKDGYVTNYELADFLVTHSNENDTDVKQLKKVFAYFGLNNYLLDIVQDVGKGRNMKGSDYKYGVEYKIN